MLGNTDTLWSSFLISFFFQHRNKIKATNFAKHRRETSSLHTLSHKRLKSFDFIISLQSITILRFYEVSWHAGTGSSSFINPVVDSDDEDDNIFQSERSFSAVFNTFVNQWCVKKDKNVFKLIFRFYHGFPKIPEVLETYAYKKFKFQRYRDT